jgi:hypothetical protein
MAAPVSPYQDLAFIEVGKGRILRLVPLTAEDELGTLFPNPHLMKQPEGEIRLLI